LAQVVVLTCSLITFTLEALFSHVKLVILDPSATSKSRHWPIYWINLFVEVWSHHWSERLAVGLSKH
jgi:hypothetical protein